MYNVIKEVVDNGTLDYTEDHVDDRDFFNNATSEKYTVRLFLEKE